jgi:RNA polymerase sigma-70 factor (ECF subfamily)
VGFTLPALVGVGVAELSHTKPLPPDREDSQGRTDAPGSVQHAEVDARQTGVDRPLVGGSAELHVDGLPDLSGTRESDAAAVIARHQTGVWRFLRVLGCDSNLADDLTQETFLQLLRQPSFVHHSDAATAAYLRRTARNLYISRHRRERRMQVGTTAEAVELVWLNWTSPHDDSDELLSQMAECLQGLTERARLALRMRFADNASRNAIGEALGISEHGAKNLMQRAKQQLRECIESKHASAER